MIINFTNNYAHFDPLDPSALIMTSTTGAWKLAVPLPKLTGVFWKKYHCPCGQTFNKFTKYANHYKSAYTEEKYLHEQQEQAKKAHVRTAKRPVQSGKSSKG